MEPECGNNFFEPKFSEPKVHLDAIFFGPNVFYRPDFWDHKIHLDKRFVLDQNFFGTQHFFTNLILSLSTFVSPSVALLAKLIFSSISATCACLALVKPMMNKPKMSNYIFLT